MFLSTILFILSAKISENTLASKSMQNFHVLKLQIVFVNKL